MLETFRTPQFDIPFAAQFNDALPAASALMWEWVDTFGLARGPAARTRLELTELDRLTAWVHPTANVPQLALVTEWMVWFFQLDDQLDDGPLGYQPEKWDTAFAGLLAACGLATDYAADRSSDSPLAVATRDLWERTIQGRSAAWVTRFRRNTEEYLRSYHAEAGFRADGYIPTVDSYLAHRRKSDAMGMCMDLVEVALDAEVPERALALPSFRALRETTGIVPGLVNDIFSFPKEFAADYFYNAVYVVLAAEGGSVQSAVDRVNDMITDYVRRFQRAEKKLEQDLTTSAHARDPAEEAAVWGCVAEYRGWMRGFLEWSYGSLRYSQYEQVSFEAPPSYLEELLNAPREAR